MTTIFTVIYAIQIVIVCAATVLLIAECVITKECYGIFPIYILLLELVPIVGYFMGIASCMDRVHNIKRYRANSKRK